jgi:uncharacterized protein (DUF1501 family)
METGTPGRKGTRSGWLNRAVGLLGHEGTPFRAVSMTKALPRSFYGDAPALAIANLENFGIRIRGNERLAQGAEKIFKSLYEGTSQGSLHRAGRDSFEAIRMLSTVDLSHYRPAHGAVYPRSPLGNNLRQIAQLIKADVGLEVAFAECGGWDTHVQQGTANGSFARRVSDLARSIVAFWTDLDNYQDDVVLMTMTEFGRTVHENGSGGTDHGRGSCLFVLGNQVDGRKVHGTVPSLVPEALEDGRDLPVTTDFRAVFAEVASKHYPRSPLGNNLRQIAQLIKADVGLEVAFAECGGWDTHVQQGTANGSFARRVSDLARSIVAFWTDLDNYQDDVVLMTMTEFGRTVHENGSGGTDHGRGSCLFVLGNQVDGRKVHGTVPSLVPEALEDGRDLPVTTDFRAVFAEVASKHLGISDDRALFPGWVGERFSLLS